MYRAGVVIAIETEGFFRHFGAPDETLNVHGKTVWKYTKEDYELYSVRSGAGEVYAAMAAQLLISEFHVNALFNFGVVGGLNEEISQSRLCVVKDVVHYEFDTSELDPCEPGRYMHYDSVHIPTDAHMRKLALDAVPGLKEVSCASGNRFVGKPEDKRRLAEEFGCEICEMEAAGVVLTADWNHVPCLLLKMVADGINGGPEEFEAELERTSVLCAKALDSVLKACAAKQS